MRSVPPGVQVARRWAQIHPFITIIGAFAGLRFFSLLGLLIGPLAISYFFELIRMYRAEYLTREPSIVEAPAVGEPEAASPRSVTSPPRCSSP